MQRQLSPACTSDRPATQSSLRAETVGGRVGWNFELEDGFTVEGICIPDTRIAREITHARGAWPSKANRIEQNPHSSSALTRQLSAAADIDQSKCAFTHYVLAYAPCSCPSGSLAYLRTSIGTPLRRKTASRLLDDWLNGLRGGSDPHEAYERKVVLPRIKRLLAARAQHGGM
jgi:hypothetical protein